jgi:hypothetical protein
MIIRHTLSELLQDLHSTEVVDPANGRKLTVHLLNPKKSSTYSTGTLNTMLHEDDYYVDVIMIFRDGTINYCNNTEVINGTCRFGLDGLITDVPKWPVIEKKQKIDLLKASPAY